MDSKPRVLVIGLPQAGKTTLARALTAADATCDYLDSDTASANAILNLAAPVGVNAVVLAIDATDAKLDQQFAQFETFLQRSRGMRGRYCEIGGLPLFLALTKCDALSPMIESSSARQTLIEQRSRSVQTHFQKWLDEPPRRLPFGSLAVDAVTTTQLPRLATDCAAAAKAHATRQIDSSIRLRLTLGIFVLMLLAMLTMAAICWYGTPLEDYRLHREVVTLRDQEKPPAIRFAPAALAGHLHQLRQIADHPRFTKLASEDQRFIREQLAEAAAYESFSRRLASTLIGPAEVRTDAELQALELELAGVLAPPREYDAAWHETQAGRLYRKWQIDATLVRVYRDRQTKSFREDLQRATDLLLAPAFDEVWGRAADRLGVRVSDFPYPEITTPIPESPVLELPRGEALTLAPVLESDRVQQSRADWFATSERLGSLHELCEALGLLGTPATLAIPESNVPRTLAVDLLQKLEAKYPSRDWTLDRFPEPGRGVLRKHILELHRRGLQSGRIIVKDIVGIESRENWLKAIPKLETDEVFAAWGKLLNEIETWNGQRAGDPVKDLCDYVRRTEFIAKVPSLEIVIPENLRTQAVTVAGPLTLTITSPDASMRVIEFQHTGFNRFKPKDATIRFRPGDVISATLPVRVGDSTAALEWNRGRSTVFTADRLLNEPILRRETPEPASGVIIRIPPPGLWPALPLLMPDISR